MIGVTAPVQRVTTLSWTLSAAFAILPREAGLRRLRLRWDAEPEEDAAPRILDAVVARTVLALHDTLAVLVHVVDAGLLVLRLPCEPGSRGDDREKPRPRQRTYDGASRPSP